MDLCPQIQVVHDMKISIVIQDLYRLGAQYVTSLLASGLAQRGHDVEVVVSAVHTRIGNERPSLKPFPLPLNVNLVILPNVKASRNVFSLVRYLRKRNPDIILSMSTNYFVASALASPWVSKRTIFINVEHAHSVCLPEILTLGNFIKRPFLTTRYVLVKWCWHRMTRVIAVSDEIARIVHKRMGIPVENIATIYNPVVDEWFFRKKSQPSNHPWLKVKDKPVIVAAGAHVKVKAQDVLIKAFKMVRESVDCRLILFGDGVLTQSLKDLAVELELETDVSFPGYTMNLPTEMTSADVVVVPSLRESFSVVLVEALACGVPVVSTNTPGGPPEILKNGQYGILVEPNDPHALAEGILCAMSDTKIVPPEESWQPYALDKVTDQYEAVFRELVGENSV
jgi:glycosyltransferase involved in cell wall biosynthesis